MAMILWRVIDKRFREHALGGSDAKFCPGPWHTQGAAVIYTSTSKSLALLEILLHTDQFRLPLNHQLCASPILVPNSVGHKRIELSELPHDWQSTIPSQTTQRLGAEWMSAKEFAILLVPSQIIHGEHTALINPAHDDFLKIVPAPLESIFWNDIPFKASQIMNVEAHKDVFLCHAHEDKAAIVEPLFRALFSEGVSCWYDNAEIKWGDSITEKVSEGLAKSEYVIVVLTKHFLKKNWPKRELMAALNKESSTGKVVVLPLVAGDEAFRKQVEVEFFLQSDKLHVEWKVNPGEIASLMRDRLRSA